MIGQHPELTGLPELKLFCSETIGELEASLPRFWNEQGITHRSPGLVRAVAHFEFGGQESDSLGLARDWLRHRSHWSGADVFDALLQHVSPRSAVEKSPENVETDTALKRLASAYPRARYLHLTRHPVATQRSLQKYYERIVPGHEIPGQPTSGIAYWMQTHCRILAFAATLPTGRYLRIGAEEVLNDSAAQLRAIATWLDICDDDTSIERMMHPEESPFARLGNAVSGIVGGNDPGFLRDPIPRRVKLVDSLDQPPGWAADSTVWAMVVEMANRFGYH
jgi:hypothetical protein